MSQTALFNYFKTHQTKDLELLICEDFKEALQLESVAKFFKRDVLLFPDFRPSFGDDLRSYREELHELLSSLRIYYRANKKPLIISPLKTLLFPLPKEELLQSTTLEFGGTIELQSFKEQMLFWGYNFVDMVQVAGEISFRGDIIDIYTPSAPNPVRISLFDNEIEQIKYFELESQRTLKKELDKFEVTSAFYSLEESAYNSLTQKIELSEFDALVKDISSLGFWFLGENAVDFMADKKVMLSKNLDDALKDAYGINAPVITRDKFDLELLEESDDFKDVGVADFKQLRRGHQDKKSHYYRCKRCFDEASRTA